MEAPTPVSVGHIVGYTERIGIVYKNPPKVAGKSVRARFVKLAGMDTVRYWRDQILPRHFDASAKERYGYEGRSKYTMQRKASKRGHQILLREKGAAFRTLTQGSYKVSGTGKRATLTLRGPWYLDMRKRRKNEQLSPDLKKEIVAVTDDEIKEQAVYFRRTLDKLVKSAQRTERKRIG